MKLHKDQVIIKYKKLECELCKKIYPFDYIHPDNGKSYSIVDLDHPESDYMILETLKEEVSKTFYIINTERKLEIKIGRSQDSDVKITDDISVSRNHALIRKTYKNEYFLNDCTSKFGTLVQIQYPLELTPKVFGPNLIAIQCSKTCFYIQVQ
jgi:hypothetical protein